MIIVFDGKSPAVIVPRKFRALFKIIIARGKASRLLILTLGTTQHQPIDSAESSKILAEYLTRILCEIFDYINDEDTISEIE